MAKVEETTKRVEEEKVKDTENYSSIEEIVVKARGMTTMKKENDLEELRNRH